MNNAYFSNQYTPDGIQGLEQNGDLGEDGMMGVMDANGMQSGHMMGAQSLDDIVNQNAKHVRRQSMPYGNNDAFGNQVGDRRLSLMDFGNGGAGTGLDEFNFNPSAADVEAFMNSAAGMSAGNDNSVADGTNSLVLNTQLNSSNFDAMGLPGSAYTSPIHTGGNMDMDIASPFLTTPIPMGMDTSDPSMTMNDHSPFYQPLQQLSNSAVSSPLHKTYTSSPQRLQSTIAERRLSQSRAADQHSSSHAGSDVLSTSQRLPMGSKSSFSGSRSMSLQNQPSPLHKSVTFDPNPSTSNPTPRNPNVKLPWQVPSDNFPSSMQGRSHMSTQYKDAYSSTGFDMLNVLMRVAARPNPQINIGAVDMSCAFVVTDAEKDDCPIVYCSENFERLTGYTKHMILGRNCRFLQSPDGNVEPGIRRKYVDDDSVLFLKNTILEQKEAQISLINYRRGGQPFVNLLTMIPISMDGSKLKFFVGFQVDLVEQPNAVTSKNQDGSYTINYQRGLSMPRYMVNPPHQQEAAQLDLGQTITRDDVSMVLTTIGTGESELSKRIWDKVLLENTDDVVHVLSLKGLFLYLSPSSLKVLEYEANELIGTALSSVCHPSDIVPVTRELKDTSNGASVNVVFRIRRKKSGYMWFESHGSLHTEHGKGRKCIILVGRERPVYTIAKNDLAAAGGIGENELWTKLSTSGMFLFVSSNVRQLLDRQPEELVGTSIQTLMRQESKREIARVLSLARTGKKASVHHEMMNKRGQVLKAYTVIYPGDATEGQKPTFVVAQTKLIRFQRGNSSTIVRVPLLSQKTSEGHDSNLSMQSHSMTSGNQTPLSSLSMANYVNTDGNAVTSTGGQGLLLGRQDASLASEENLFDELKTTRGTSWQYELRQMERQNRLLAEEVQHLLAAKKKRKRRKGAGQLQKDCANCHTRTTPEWRRGPSGNRDLCNSCGLRWAKQNGRISPRASSQRSAQSDKASKASASPNHNTASSNEHGNTPSGHQQTPNSAGPPSAWTMQQSGSGLNSTRMDSGAGQVPGSTLPLKIEEDPEPDSDVPVTLS